MIKQWRANNSNCRAAASALAVLLAVLLIPTTVTPLKADILSRLLLTAERAGSKAASKGARKLDVARRHAKKFVVPGNGAAVAAHVGSEGHWTFINKAGEKFTAGNSDELARAIPTLAPKATASAGGRLIIILSEDTVFNASGALKQLPKHAELRIATPKKTYRLRQGGKPDELFAEIRPNVIVGTSSKAKFEEALWQLNRPLRRSNIRVLALDPSGPATLRRTPKIDAKTKRAITDRIAPKHLPKEMANLKGQTLVVVGRIDAGKLVYRAGSGREYSLDLDALRRAAASGDVNVLVLNTRSPRQPGVRNWLWQRAHVSGLDDALKRATMADFLNAVASSNNSVLRFRTTAAGNARIRFGAEPDGPASPTSNLGIDKIMSEVVSEVAGQVVTTAITGDFRNAKRQRELDLRIIPGIPSSYQFAYLLSLIAGLMGLSFVRAWWARIWPPEQRAEYRGPAGYHFARLTKFLCFVFIFMPLVAIPAAILTFGSQILAILLLPVRLLVWFVGLFSRAKA